MTRHQAKFQIVSWDGKPISPPLPKVIREEINALVREYEPEELKWTVDEAGADQALIYGTLRSGHVVEARRVYLEEVEDREALKAVKAFEIEQNVKAWQS